jgi:Amt family ammonium transporter
MTTKASPVRVLCGMAAFSFALGCVPALAETAPPPKIDAADTAWMISATALVLMMTIPGLALFYCGMVRKKNVLATMAQSLLCAALCSLLWMVIGYTLAFGSEGTVIGNLDRLFLRGIGLETIHSAAKTIPEMLFMMYQMTFAIITVALVAGSVADRMRFSAFVWFAILWMLIVYVPIAHWVWGGGFLMTAGLLDFAGGTVVHLNAGVAGLVAAYVIGNRYGYGTDNFSPYNLSLAVIGTGLLWVGWFGFNGGSALGAGSRAVFAIVATHLAAAVGALTWMAIEWWTRGKPSVLGMISGAVAGLGTITPALLCGVFAVAALSDAPGTPGTAGLLEGNSGQVLIQLYGIAVTAVWSGVATFIILKVIEFIVPLRVSQQSEIEGLDVTQHGEALQ